MGTIPYLLGGNLYPGSIHTPSHLNPSDDPSRDVPCRAPCRDLPQWYLDLDRGDLRRFDIVVFSNRFPRALGAWVRILLMRCGDIEPHPGPVGYFGSPCAQPPALDDGPGDAGNVRDVPLAQYRGVAVKEQDLRDRSMKLFRLWLDSHIGAHFDCLLDSPLLMSQALRGFIQYCWQGRAPVYIATQAILAVVDLREDWRRSLDGAWRLIKIWKRRVPTESRLVMPPALMRAVLAVALVRGWFAWAGVTMMGFFGLLHPKNMLALQRGDLVFPEDQFGAWVTDLFIHVREPKTKRVVHLQHACVSEPTVIRFLYVVFGASNSTDRLWPSSDKKYRQMWDSILMHLGVMPAVRLLQDVCAALVLLFSITVKSALMTYNGGADGPKSAT